MIYVLFYHFEDRHHCSVICQKFHVPSQLREREWQSAPQCTETRSMANGVKRIA